MAPNNLAVSIFCLPRLSRKVHTSVQLAIGPVQYLPGTGNASAPSSGCLSPLRLHLRSQLLSHVSVRVKYEIAIVVKVIRILEVLKDGRS